MPICLPFLSHLLRSPPGAPAPALAALAAAPRAPAPPAAPPLDPAAVAPATPPAPPASAPWATSPVSPAAPPRVATLVPLFPPGIDGATAASTSWAATRRISGEYRRPSCAGFIATPDLLLTVSSMRRPFSSTTSGVFPPWRRSLGGR